jgi:uncharacterized protein YkwD
MKRSVHRCLLTAATLLLLIGIASPIQVRAQSGQPAEILRLVNQLRTGYGLAPFVWDNSLAVAAQNQANYMATNNIYSHTGAGGSTPASRAISAGYPGYATENIVGGTDLTPSQGVTWWKNSAIHFNTMISERYVHAGVGFAQGHGQYFYALVVGVPSDRSTAPAARSNPSGEALAPVAPIQLAAPGEDGSVIHEVAQGHTFWAIAARYEIPLEQLYLYNNIDENSVINPGDKLLIHLADGQSPPPTPTPPASHFVSEGESLWTIAAWYKLSLDDLLVLNGIKEDSLLSPGDEIRIRLLPGESPPPTATPITTHIINSGDTAWGIAQAYGLSIEDLLSFNNMVPDSILSIGDRLLVVAPTAVPTASPTMTATTVPAQTAVPTITSIPNPTNTPQTTDASLEIPTIVATELPEVDNSVNQFPILVIVLLGLGLIGAGAISIIFFRQS